MVELERQESKEYQKSFADSQAAGGKNALQPKKDRLLLAILATMIGLAALVIGIAVFWGTGPVLAQVPWYIPLISSFVALATLTVAFVAFGRYHVLRDPVSFWVGCGFAAYGIGQIFYALSWPGLLAEGRSILGNLPSTPALIVLTSLSILVVFLLSAVLVPWSGKQSLAGNRWFWVVVVWVVVAIAVYSLILRFETYLPILVDASGVFTSEMRIWAGILLITFAASSIFSTRYYRRSRDRLAGLIVFPQLALVFICMMVLIGGKRYDLWWYLQRVVLAGGYLTVLFGLLFEYIRLLQRASGEQRMLAVILENIPVGLAVTDGPPHYPITRMSRHGLEMNQGQVDGLIDDPLENGLRTLKILLPGVEAQPSPEQIPIYRASHFGEEVRNTELVVETRDGQRVPVLMNAAPIHDVQGNVVAAISTWLDITDRKRAEETLKASEALYRAIARSIPRGGIFVVDKDLRYIIAEGIITEKLGVSKEMLEGHTVSEVFDEEIAARMEARFRRAFEGETISYETEHNRRIYWTQHAVMDDPLGHAIVVTLDITERKLAEKALSESEQRFRAIINQSTAGILRSDIDGQSVFVNQAFCELLGYRESELIGETIWKLIHPEDQEESRRLFEHLTERGRSFQLEARLIHQDGSVLWVNVSASPILDEVDTPQSAVFIVVDITERKQAEQDLQELNLQLENRVQARTAELQSANRALSESRRRLQVLSQRIVDVQEDERRSIARELHDRVGQTLTALNLNLTIVNDQLASQSMPAVKDRLADSIKLVTEMIAIVRDVMSDLRPVVLDEYGLEAALQAYVAKFEARYGIGVEFVRSSRPLPPVGAGLEMTVLRIAQEALLNIARHAHADRVSLSLQCENDAVLLTVEDNGVGMQAWQDTGRLNGHGLMLMRERAEAVGGTLKINSIISRGTRIDAYLPFQNDGKLKPEKEGSV